MRKLSFIANIVLAVIVYCLISKESKGEGAGPVKSFRNAGTASTYGAFPGLCGNDAFYGMRMDEFIQGIARYRRTHWDLIQRNDSWFSSKRFDARSDWYSIDTLKKYICLLEEYARQLSPVPAKLGIRIYYATYPAVNRRDPGYAGLHTLFMVPTYNNNGGNVDFDPRYSMLNGQSAKIYTIPEIYAANPKTPLFTLESTSPDAESLERNQGRLCPPNCPTSSAMTIADRVHPGGLGR